jgi:hypothetical protein
LRPFRYNSSLLGASRPINLFLLRERVPILFASLNFFPVDGRNLWDLDPPLFLPALNTFVPWASNHWLLHSILGYSGFHTQQFSFAIGLSRFRGSRFITPSPFDLLQIQRCPAVDAPRIDPRTSANCAVTVRTIYFDAVGISVTDESFADVVRISDIESVNSGIASSALDDIAPDPSVDNPSVLEVISPGRSGRGDQSSRVLHWHHVPIDVR